MSLSHYSAQCAPAPAAPLTGMQRLVLIDTASRVATRLLDGRRGATMAVTEHVGPVEIELFRTGPHLVRREVVARIVAQLTHPKII